MESTRPKSILVIEDEDSIRDNLQLLLSMEGYNVSTAANGKEALTVLNTAPPPELIILDLMMPVMDGFKFREIQRTLPQAANIPLLIMSADGNVKLKNEALGASGYLRKPVDIDDFLGVVATYF